MFASWDQMLGWLPSVNRAGKPPAGAKGSSAEVPEDGADRLCGQA